MTATLREPRMVPRARVRLPASAEAAPGENGRWRVRYVDLDTFCSGTALVQADTAAAAVKVFRSLHPDFLIVGGNLPTSADPKLCTTCGSAHAGWRGIGYGHDRSGHEFKDAA